MTELEVLLFVCIVGMGLLATIAFLFGKIGDLWLAVFGETLRVFSARWRACEVPPAECRPNHAQTIVQDKGQGRGICSKGHYS